MSGRDAAPDRPGAAPVQEAADHPPTRGTTSSRRAPLAPGEPTDESLVERARGGESVAFRKLVERYQRRVYQLAFGVVKDHEDAMDVVQEAFVKVHQHLPGFKGDSAFFTWVYRITYNLAIDSFRRAGRGEKVELDENTLTDESSQHEAYGAGSQSPQKAALRGELSAELQRALGTLSDNHRAILLLREVDGLSYEELSQVLKIPKGTVMSRLFHARHKMQTVLRDYLGEDAPDEENPEADDDSAAGRAPRVRSTKGDAR